MIFTDYIYHGMNITIVYRHLGEDVSLFFRHLKQIQVVYHIIPPKKYRVSFWFRMTEDKMFYLFFRTFQDDGFPIRQLAVFPVSFHEFSGN